MKALFPHKTTLVLFILVMHAVLFMCIYTLLQNPAFYFKNLASFMPTYENQDAGIIKVSKPFAPLTQESLQFADADHYAYIRDHLYTYGPHKGSVSNFAFFPLFPMLWKICPGAGIIVLNWLLHVAAVLLLAYTFCRDKIADALILILALPTLSVFLLPYTEALFLFLVSAALWAYRQKKRHLYIAALLLASMTRPVFFLFLATAIAMEIFQFIRYKKINVRHFGITVLTILAGTFTVAALQYCFHPESPLEFIYIQKLWDTYFRIPQTISDWSAEGYGMNTWALLFIPLFGTAILVKALFGKANAGNDRGYWYYFSWIYLVATCGYVLLFQGGCLHSLYRYTLSSPFFYVVLMHHVNDADKRVNMHALLLFIPFIVAVLVFYHSVEYASGAIWTFSGTGFFLLIANLLAFVLLRNANRLLKYGCYTLLILAAIVWNAYLCNMYVTKAWLFL